MGIYRAVGNYASGMVISIATIPVTICWAARSLRGLSTVL